jgi:hypothetical protein
MATSAAVSDKTNEAVAGPTPDAIMQLGFGFWGSRALLCAVELGVFTELANTGPLDAESLTDRLGLDARGARDFFDALVALGLLERDDGSYHNTDAADLFLDRAKPSYVGGILEMGSVRMYGIWNGLTEGLRTGAPQNEITDGGNPFDAIYADPDTLRRFVKAMTGVSLGVAQVLASSFPWERYQSVIDVGGAEGCVPVQLALAHPHLTGGVFELSKVGPFVEEYVAAAGLSDRLRFYQGDFFVDPLPTADVLIMGHILHDWNANEKRLLLEKAHRALPEGGALIVYEAIIDDGRRENAFGLLMSLNMVLETPGGFDFTGAECQQWMGAVGFRETYVQHLAGPDSMVVGIK